MTTRKFIPTEEWEDQRQVLGLKGEQEAMAYLTSRGYDIEEHRFRLGRHDVDIIARQGSLVAFVEVKTRRGHGFGAGVEAVGRRKQATIAKVASLWCLRCGRPGDTYRFDVVSVEEGADGRMTVEHLENAWWMDGVPK